MWASETTKEKMNMQTNSENEVVKQCLVLTAVLMCASCSTPRDSDLPDLYGNIIYVLRWEDYNGIGDPNSASFFLDDVHMGTGELGIKRVMETLELVEDSAILIVSWQDDMRGGRPRYHLPYDALGYHLHMERLLRKKKILALNNIGEYAFAP